MQLVLMHPNAAPIQREKDLSVVVVCEDGTTAPRACTLLDRVARGASRDGRLIYSWWTFSVLASPLLWHLASREVAEVDMIVVASHEGPRLPVAIKDYLRLWLASRDDSARPSALVALLESEPKPNGSSCGVLSELKKLAESGAVDFFANGDEVSADARLLAGIIPPSGNSQNCANRREARIAGRPGPQATKWVRAWQQHSQAGQDKNEVRAATEQKLTLVHNEIKTVQPFM